MNRTWTLAALVSLLAVGFMPFGIEAGDLPVAPAPRPVPNPEQAAKGRELFLKLQCITCHTAKVDGRAPVLEGLYGTKVLLADGKVVRVDKEYLKESILEPRTKVVAGWQAIMPSYDGQVTDKEVACLIAYIRSLKRGGAIGFLEN
ncbi:MAG TPA: cytochrome c [Gemmata sp.]|nr:cytochrome c [Gemmata sp.]